MRVLMVLAWATSAAAFTGRQAGGGWAMRARGGADDEPLLPDDDAADALFGGQGGGGMPQMPTTPEAMAEELKNLESYSKAMENLMKSGEMEEFFSDDEKIEEARQAIIGNEMMMEMLQQIPGANMDALKDPVAWREQMKQAKELFEMQKSLFNKGEADADDLDD